MNRNKNVSSLPNKKVDVKLINEDFKKYEDKTNKKIKSGKSEIKKLIRGH